VISYSRPVIGGESQGHGPGHVALERYSRPVIGGESQVAVDHVAMPQGCSRPVIGGESQEDHLRYRGGKVVVAP